MRKITAGILALSLALSLCACDQTSSSNVPSDGQTSSADGQNPSTEQQGTGSFATNPVKVDENGEVDMEAALAYETDVDALLKELEATTPDPTKPVSKNANEETVALFNFLRENYGKKMFAGQQLFDENQYEDLVYYIETGDLPAIKGFDFIFSTGNQEANDYQIDEAIKWHTEQNGIVTFCWHWKVPVNINNDKVPGIAFYSDEIQDFSLKNAVTPGTKEYETVIKDIDTVALKLQRLEAAGVPVLWRPLHEASGSWFWWGVKDKESVREQCFQKLWYMVYDRLENYHKLTNLIWIWNGQNKITAVNENTFDIAGIDVYPNSETHEPQAASYKTLKGLVESDKMLALTECGYIPDPDLVFAEDNEAKWLYYLPWCGEFICNAGPTGNIITQLGGTPSVNTSRISSELLKKVYASDNVITLSELPDFDGTQKFIPAYIKTWRFNNPDYETAESKLTAYSSEPAPSEAIQ